MLIGHNKRNKHNRASYKNDWHIKLQLQHLAGEVIPTFLHTAAKSNLILLFTAANLLKIVYY